MRAPTLRTVLAVLALSACAVPAAAGLKPDPASPLLKVAEYHMTHARRGAAIAAAGDYIYIFGGSGGGGPIYRAERLNVLTGQVELLAPDFLARRFHSVVEHRGKFHIIGGQGYALPGRVQEETIEIYDPATNEITRTGRAPNPRSLAAVAKLGDEVLVVGGARNDNNGTYLQTNRCEIYTPETGTWRPGPPMPTPRAAPAVVVGQLVLVPGGYASRSSLKTVEMFVPQEQVWKKLPDLGMTVIGHSAAFLGRWVFLFGDNEESDLMLAYELSTRKTIRLKPSSAPMRFSAALTHGDRIYVVGGAAADTIAVGGGRVLDARSGGETDLIQVFALNPDYKPK